MNNRDLLVNAAKAAGIQGKYYVAYHERYINEGIDTGNCHLWNPLTCNEDAFSLMVNIYMGLDVRDNEVTVNNPDTGVSYKQPVSYGEDREEATRLAIVNCAAIVGSYL